MLRFHHAWTKLLYITAERRAVGHYRYCDAKGQSALQRARDYVDATVALCSAVLRQAFGYRMTMPWITFPAFRYLCQNLPPEAVVFEWGSGMSTLWFAGRGCKVYSAEDSQSWYSELKKRATQAKIYLLQGFAYISKIEDFPRESFDVIVVDGSHRLACFERAHPYLKPQGLLVVDNTDWAVHGQEDMGAIDRSLLSRSDYEVLRFTGWLAGNFHPLETTICVKR
jgi:hypothetical protein